MDKLRFRICVSVIACTLCIVSLPAARAFNDKNVAAPFITTFSKADNPGTVVIFSQEDFSSRLSGKDTLEGIVVNALPPAECGVLKANGKPVSCGEGFSANAINSLSFEPFDGANIVHTTFSFIPVFNEYGAGDKSVSVSINLDSTKNSAPIAENMECETYKDLDLQAEFKATDIDGDACEYTIVAAPKKGEIEIIGNSFVYSPKPAESYKDSFTFCATDSNGNSSNPATVKIVVKKRADKAAISYADLEQNSAHYPAIRLAEAGIFSGASIGNIRFLEPEREVSRAEFIAMVISASNIAVPTGSISSGLADDAQIPAWAKSASAAALNSGIVKGSPDGSGSRVLRANEPITIAEAAAVLDRAAMLQSTDSIATFSDSASVPAWASVAVSRASVYGIISSSDGAAHANDKLLRAEAVQMVYNAAKLAQAQKTGGLKIIN